MAFERCRRRPVEFDVLEALAPLAASMQQHLSNSDCLEDKRKVYHNCSVLYYIPQLCAIKYACVSNSYSYR